MTDNDNGDDFSAAANQERDLYATDKSSLFESKTLFSDEERINKATYRWMRIGAFSVFGGIAALYFLFLLKALYCISNAQSFAAIFGASSDWHHLLFVAGIFGVFAAVPLSISMSLVKMVSESKAENDRAATMTTAQAEAFKAFMAFVSAFKR